MEIFVCNNDRQSDLWLLGKACENAAKTPNSIHYIVVETMVDIHFHKVVEKLERMKVSHREWEDAIIELPSTNARIELCPLNSIGILQEINIAREQFAYFPDFGNYPIDFYPTIGSSNIGIVIKSAMYSISNLSDIWLAQGTKFFQGDKPYNVSTSFKRFSEINNNGISVLILKKIIQQICMFAKVGHETITFNDNVNLAYCKECGEKYCFRLGEKTIVDDSCPYYTELYLEKLKNEGKA